MGDENEGGYKPNPGQEHNWPGSADEEYEKPMGKLGVAADILEMTDVVPLLGSAVNIGKLLVDGGSALYHGSQAKSAYRNNDSETGSSKMDQAEEDANDMTGDLINAIPLVGTARAMM